VSPVRFGLKPENPIEAVLTRLNVVPRPLIETQMAFTLARIIMVGTKLGVFDALANGAANSASVAGQCRIDPAATEKLLFALAGAGYLRSEGNRYALTPVTRKWLLRDSPASLVDKLLFQFDEWDWMARAEDYVRSGRSLDLHELISGEQWGLYQRGMRALAGTVAAETVRRLPVPRGATQMLDIGGSHGYYSVALCRRYENLRSIVLDLPQAIDHAAPLLAKEGMGDRVVHRSGNALTEELGREAYDVVFTAQLVHHLNQKENRDLAIRVARALRPGGVYAILEEFRPRTAKDAGQLGALLEFYFALTSESGTWAPEEMAAWQRDAGLRPHRPIHFRTVPGLGIQAATKT
jgi:2-polyprenyl-3-methyl-5-hydroxy-6-metoxy-1,4-benzoquinol methylase